MGWSTGSEILSALVDIIVENVADTNVRENMYRSIVELFEDHDCDTFDECAGDDPVLDNVLKDMGWIDQEDEDEDEDF